MRPHHRQARIDRRVAFAATIVLAITFASSATAHELKPAYLEVTATNPTDYTVVWKSPIVNGRILAVEPRFPDDCNVSDRSTRSASTIAIISNWQLSCDALIAGRRIEFLGLDATLTDVLVRLQSDDGAVQTLRATPNSPVVHPAEVATRWNVARNYFFLGVEHILSGADHLLFVVAMVLLISGTRRLIETITAFTVAHSLTLAATALGWLQLSPAPVEAVIALSIVFMASELARMQSGEERLSMRRPWVVAFVFGLMHGFGFAGALAEIGLPAGEIPVALLTFNLGVEAGQLAFVSGMLVLLLALERVVPRHRIGLVASYPIGVVSSMWLIERVII